MRLTVNEDGCCDDVLSDNHRVNDELPQHVPKASSARVSVFAVPLNYRPAHPAAKSLAVTWQMRRPITAPR